MDVNLLVSYDSNGGFFAGKNEVQAILGRLGDQRVDMELLAPGVMGVKTKLDSRKVVEDVRELFLGDPNSIKFALMWVPVDYWGVASLDSINRLVRDEIRDLIFGNNSVFVDVVNHKSALKTDEVVKLVSSLMRGKVVSERAQKIVRVELFDGKVSVTLLGPRSILVVEK